MLVSPVAAKIETIDEGHSLVPAGEAEEGVEGGGDGELPLPYGHPAPRPLQARAGACGWVVCEQWVLVCTDDAQRMHSGCTAVHVMNG